MEKTYDTFDSGSGPVIPEGEKDAMAHNDSAEGVSTFQDQAKDLAVPEVPQSK